MILVLYAIFRTLEYYKDNLSTPIQYDSNGKGYIISYKQAPLEEVCHFEEIYDQVHINSFFDNLDKYNVYWKTTSADDTILVDKITTNVVDKVKTIVTSEIREIIKEEVRSVIGDEISKLLSALEKSSSK